MARLTAPAGLRVSVGPGRRVGAGLYELPIQVTFTRRARARLFLSRQLVRLAVAVAPHLGAR